MANILLPILAGTWPAGLCPQTWQETLNNMAQNMNAVLPGMAFYSFGSDKPAPEFQAYPWLRTTDGRWYVFSGVWRSPNNYSEFDRRWFPGTLTDLITYDGGSAGTVTPTAGPMWVEDETMRGRSPMGPGDIPGVTPTVTLAVNTDYGAGEHTLTEAEGGVGVHTHAFGQSNVGNDDAYFSNPGPHTGVASYTGYYITGSNGNIITAQTTADLFTLPSGATGAGVPTPTPFSVVHPVRGWYAIKPSGRQYYVVP